MSTQLDRIEQMLRALCAHLGVQDWEKLGNGAGESVGTEGGGPRYTGVVSRFEHGWGFIECEALNRNFFVHYSDIEGTGLRSLDAGDTVAFEVAPGKDGRPKAVRVRRQSAGQPVAKTPRTAAAAHRAGHGYRDRGMESDEEFIPPAAPAAVSGSPAPETPTTTTPDGSGTQDDE